MKLVNIFGPGSVGKMTVGQELMKITELRLFHNHMTIEPVLEIFGSFHVSTIIKLRDVIFEEFVKTDQEGIVFTFMFGFDHQEDWDLINKYHKLFVDHGGEVFYVELEASQEVRLKRNATPNRLQHKKSKRDLEASNQRMKNEDEKHRLNSHEGEIPYENYLRINNENLSANEVAQIIKKHFNL
jgi:hypothetical protein